MMYAKYHAAVAEIRGATAHTLSIYEFIYGVTL
jgi:hypothetical protein